MKKFERPLAYHCKTTEERDLIVSKLWKFTSTELSRRDPVRYDFIIAQWGGDPCCFGLDSDYGDNKIVSLEEFLRNADIELDDITIGEFAEAQMVTVPPAKTLVQQSLDRIQSLISDINELLNK